MHLGVSSRIICAGGQLWSPCDVRPLIMRLCTSTHGGCCRLSSARLSRPQSRCGDPLCNVPTSQDSLPHLEGVLSISSSMLIRGICPPCMAYAKPHQLSETQGKPCKVDGSSFNYSYSFYGLETISIICLATEIRAAEHLN